MAKKRGNGEGSIYRCKDRPGYRAAYTVQTAKGPRRRYVSGKTRREVEEKLTRAKAERDGGWCLIAIVGGSAPTLKDGSTTRYATPSSSERSRTTPTSCADTSHRNSDA